MYQSEVEEIGDIGRLCMRSLEGVRNVCNTGLMGLRNALVLFLDEKQFRDFVNDTNCGLNVHGLTGNTFEVTL